MNDTAVRKATASDVERLAGVLLRAFFDDPVITWMLPDAARRARVGERAYRTFLERDGPRFVAQLLRFEIRPPPMSYPFPVLPGQIPDD